jgi:CheY-like chemotaxis protein
LEKAGYRTLTASDGAEGLAVFTDNKAEIEAVLTDVAMPVIDGLA